MKALVLSLMFLVTATATAATTTKPSAPATPEYLSYTGSAELTDIKSGKLTSTIRVGDRTQGAHAFKVGEEVALVNGDKTQETRTFAAQISANAYGHVKFTAISTAQFTSLSPADQQEVLKYYQQAQIDKANGIVSMLSFTFVP